MLTTTLTLITSATIGQFFFGNPLPLDTDHLKAPPGEKRVMLIMDVSGSMLGDDRYLSCAWFDNPAAHGGIPYNTGSPGMNKNEQMKAAAVGCLNGTDGFLDQWVEQVDFAITGFGYSFPPYVRPVLGFTRNLTALENAVLALPAEGMTPMQLGILTGGRGHSQEENGTPVWDNSDVGVNACDQHFNIIMTDGIPNDCSGDCDYTDNGGFSHVPCGAGQAFAPIDTGAAHYSQCVDRLNCDVVGAADYYRDTAELPDAVCSLDENQNITTFTIGFGSAGDINEDLMRATAQVGGGRYYYAANATQLASAFNEIINAIVTRTGRFTTPSVNLEGLYVGNDAYSASFKAVAGKPWLGNLKAHCVVPTLLATGEYATGGPEDTCIFIHRTPPLGYTGNPRTYLATNATPVDRFSSTNSLEADIGGTGWRILNDYFGNQAPGWDGRTTPTGSANPDNFAATFGPSYTDFFSRRTILTWTSPTSGYVEAHTLDHLQMMAGGCERVRLMSYLHGYDPFTVDCDHASGPRPTALNVWPLGASVNAHPTIIAWNSDCTAGPNRCVVALNMDDGGIHFFDTFNGHEHSVVIPRELFIPGTTANYPLSTVMDQPNAELTRRPFIDGPMFRLHDDRNGNGIIDSTEDAFLVFGLGHGGAGYYFMDISNAFSTNGEGQLVPDNDNPIYPLTSQVGLWTEDLRNTLSAPYVGRVRYNSSTSPALSAVFGSGHVWQNDRPGEQVNRPAIGVRPAMDPFAPGDDVRRPITCDQLMASNGIPTDPGMSNASVFDFCREGVVTPIPNLLGYDIGIAQTCLGTDPDGYDMVIGPLWYNEGVFPFNQTAGALGEITFGSFSLDPTIDANGQYDYVVLEDADQNELTPRLTGNQGANFTWNVWVASRPLFLRIHVDGRCTAGYTGVSISGLRWMADRILGGCGGGNPCTPCDTGNNNNCTGAECNPPQTREVLQACQRCDTDNNGNCSSSECGWANGGSCGEHNPFVAFVNMSKINGATPQAFTGTEDGSAELLFTRECPSTFAGRCYDASSPTEVGAVGTADLQFMYCPIVAEVRAYEEGGVARAFYVGDQCGQMWKMWTDTNGDSWSAKRLFAVNDLATANVTSKDVRRFDRPVSVVVSQCRGDRSVGLYFGTGNTARPAALDNLDGQDAAFVTMPPASTIIGNRARVRNHDVVGVFFDSGQWNTGASRTLADLQNITPNTAVEPAQLYNIGYDGWFWALNDDEQMLRDPLVFQGIAYFKTNAGDPSNATTICRPGVTIDRVYAVDNCTSAPSDPSGPGVGTGVSREAWSGSQDIGGNMMVYTPKEGPPIVSVVDVTNGSAPANVITPRINARSLQMQMWWRLR
jgi:hypothetical protein